jgi:hypothetical protein
VTDTGTSPGSSPAVGPLGAGDLIDRAVRFYRKFFWTLVLIASPPVIFGTAVSVGWTLLGSRIFAVGPDQLSAENFFYTAFLWLGNAAIWLIETIATLVVMGGASHAFVRHLLFEDAITFGATYRNIWRRLGGLIMASAIITLILGTLGTVILYMGFALTGLVIVLIIMATAPVPIVAFIASVAVGLAGCFFTLWLFFLVASRLAYVPQVMLVEGQGVFQAIARSASLAGGSVRRLSALFVFTTVAAYSALALLYVPLAWYASATGVQLMTFDADLVPAWYQIAYNVIWQISFILLSPVWMIGLCLLYVDERVRREGYDIELLAARRLGEIPDVPTSYVNPLQPALVAPTGAPVRPTSPSGITSLGLE